MALSLVTAPRMVLNKSAPLFRAALSIQNHRASITSRRTDNYNLHRVVSPLYFPSSSLPLATFLHLVPQIARVRVLDALTPVDPSTGRTPRTIPLPAFPCPSLAGNIHPSSTSPPPPILCPSVPRRGSAQGCGGEAGKDRGTRVSAHDENSAISA